jgi:hypothetical protein
VSKVTRGFLDAMQKRARFGLQMDRFAAAIVLRGLAFDPAVALHADQRTGERRLFNPEAIGQFALRKMTFREMRERPPLGLAQAERVEALIEPLPPGAGGLVNQLANGFRIDLGHR